MFDFSPIQIIIVLVIALVVFGPKRLPEMGRNLGRSLREFKSSVSGDDAPTTSRSRSDLGPGDWEPESRPAGAPQVDVEDRPQPTADTAQDAPETVAAGETKA